MFRHYLLHSSTKVSVETFWLEQGYWILILPLVTSFVSQSWLSKRSKCVIKNQGSGYSNSSFHNSSNSSINLAMDEFFSGFIVLKKHVFKTYTGILTVENCEVVVILTNLVFTFLFISETRNLLLPSTGFLKNFSLRRTSNKTRTIFLKSESWYL